MDGGSGRQGPHTPPHPPGPFSWCPGPPRPSSDGGSEAVRPHAPRSPPARLTASLRSAARGTPRKEMCLPSAPSSAPPTFPREAPLPKLPRQPRLPPARPRSRNGGPGHPPPGPTSRPLHTPVPGPGRPARPPSLRTPRGLDAGPGPEATPRRDATTPGRRHPRERELLTGRGPEGPHTHLRGIHQRRRPNRGAEWAARGPGRQVTGRGPPVRVSLRASERKGLTRPRARGAALGGRGAGLGAGAGVAVAQARGLRPRHRLPGSAPESRPRGAPGATWSPPNQQPPAEGLRKCTGSPAPRRRKRPSPVPPLAQR